MIEQLLSTFHSPSFDIHISLNSKSPASPIFSDLLTCSLIPAEDDYEVLSGHNIFKHLCLLTTAIFCPRQKKHLQKLVTFSLYGMKNIIQRKSTLLDFGKNI